MSYSPASFTFSAALFASVLVAFPSDATIAITSAAFDSGYKTGTINFSPSQLSEMADVGRFVMSGYDNATGLAATYLTYCVDLFQPLGTGDYTTKTLASTGLNTTKQAQLNALIANTATTANDATKSAAVQLAVWEILYEYQTTSNYSLTSGYLTASGTGLSSARTLANTYISNVTSGIWATDASYSLGLLQSDSKQDQLYYTHTTGADQVGEVPEPASWAMFIGGFGVIGGSLRQRRRTTSFA